jgi:hypothetical protein
MSLLRMSSDNKPHDTYESRQCIDIRILVLIELYLKNVISPLILRPSSGKVMVSVPDFGAISCIHTTTKMMGAII